MAAHGEKTWPPVGEPMAVVGEEPMAVDTQSRLRVERSTADLALTYRCRRRRDAGPDALLKVTHCGAASLLGAADRRPHRNRVRGRDPRTGLARADFRGPRPRSPSRLPQARPRGGPGCRPRRERALGLAPYGVTKMGGLRVATQFVSGASGRRRNEAMIDWAQGDSGATKCPTPGMLAMLELGSVSAAA